MAGEHRMVVSFPNRTDAATLSGGSWVAGLPLTNLQNRRRNKVARSVDADPANTRFTVTLPKPYPLRVIGLLNHNLSLAAQWRARAYDTDSPRNLIYDSGWLYAWLLTSGAWDIESLAWELDEFWYGADAENSEGLTANAFHCISSVEKIASVWEIDIADSDNPAGYVQFSRLFIGPGRQTEINYAPGAALGFENNTQVEKSLDDDEFFEVREGLRVFTFEFADLTMTEGFAWALPLTRRAGVDKEIAFIADPTDEANSLMRWFVGRLRQLSALEQPYHDTTSMRFEAKELRA